MRSRDTLLRMGAMTVLGVGMSFHAGWTAAQKGEAVGNHAKGTFEVKMVPQEDAGTSFTRMTIEKQFQGDLEGTSKGVMLATGGPKEGAGGYVALERVTGKLGGRTGSFVLQHNATMEKAT